jgi:hypothetical protein
MQTCLRGKGYDIGYGASEANWDAKFDLRGQGFSDKDGYVDVWDLMVFPDHWTTKQKP